MGSPEVKHSEQNFFSEDSWPKWAINIKKVYLILKGYLSSLYSY